MVWPNAKDDKNNSYCWLSVNIYEASLLVFKSQLQSLIAVVLGLLDSFNLNFCKVGILELPHRTVRIKPIV